MSPTMKQKSYKPFILLLVSVVLLFACKDDETALRPDVVSTYRMRLDVRLSNYDTPLTRAVGYAFVDKDQLHILFQQGTTAITGTAIYDAASSLWTITPSQSLAETNDGQCCLAFFLNAGNTSQSAVTLTPQTCIFTDATATYSLVDELLTVQGLLTPAIGRIRFHGTQGQTCKVDGLAFGTSFDLSKHTFALAASKISAICAADGFSLYYYASFVDGEKRQLTFDIGNDLGLRRGYGTDVLQAGSSGYVDIPTLDSHSGWTLINLTTGNEVTLASVSKPTVTNVGMARATVSAQVASVGGGHLNASGFVIATSQNPTVADRRLDCGMATSLSSQVTGLTPSTTYYVRAFAVNEMGTAYGEEASFTTAAEPDGTDIDLDDYPDDSSWDNQ